MTSAIAIIFSDCFVSKLQRGWKRALYIRWCVVNTTVACCLRRIPPLPSKRVEMMSIV
jgi:hypothetical protein